jgi:cell division protein FtsI (penicillin-binding protein 3)
MAGAFGAIANDGLYAAPTFTRAQASTERVVSADTARRVRAILEAAVTTEHATGTRARVEGLRVAGKTGTAEFDDASGKTHRYASFIGMAPADAPRVVVLVGAVDPKDEASGGQVAAPAFAHVAARAVAAATKP